MARIWRYFKEAFPRLNDEEMNDENDSVVYQGRPSWLYYHTLYFIGIVLFIIFYAGGEFLAGILAFLVVFGLAAIFRFRYRFMITDETITMRVGLIARNISEMKIRHIRSMHIRQGLFERLLGIGTLTTISASDGESAVIFKGIRNPDGVKRLLR